MRLDRFVCKSTELTKSEAIECIHSGEVVVNGVSVCDEATQVHENNDITWKGSLLKPRPFRHILMNKPSGTVCSNVDEVYPSLFNHLAIERKSELHIAGRLDADTTGLVLITDDGRWSFNITHPDKKCSKVYRVGLSRALREGVADEFATGIQLQGEQNLTHPAELEVITSKEVLLTITEGKFHQVKRMFAAVGNRVVSLHREKIGEVTLDVRSGEWRYLSPSEVQFFTTE
ncbi:pseudouridine synthase [Vibrio sp. ZSDE26]|uniref:Pseudouridine synthase n=1 Tax=Vibrio amylolyticus TaxID=2847292 RepID=A0A9X1XKJ1_9VIBR|nr:pseudouridine synthase [Vibrio amylolyticus]MCK6264539.1 pseudouridine synthase [Vibrio amylolyticus]